MIGLEGTSAAVADHLALLLPAKCAELDTRLSLPAGSVPPPSLVKPHEVGPLTDAKEPDRYYPAVLVIGQTMSASRPIDIIDGSQVWQFDYVLQAWVFVRAEGYAAVALLRNRYLLAVREVLMGNPIASDVVTVAVRKPWAEVYSAVAAEEKTKRSIAGAYVQFTAEVFETLAVAGLSVAETVTVAVAPHHPALD
jgi:hypothetical protein